VEDPITALLTRDWAALGGWGMFFSLAVFIVIGAFREWWVPGPRYRRQEALLDKSVNLNTSQSSQVDKLISSNEIVKHFFELRTPTRSPFLSKLDDSEGKTTDDNRGDSSDD